MRDDNVLTELKTLLNRKKEALQNIFEFSKDRTFEVSEDSVEVICLYLEKRQEYFDIIERVESKIKSGDYQRILDGSIKDKDIEALKTEINSLINSIIAIDKKNKTIMEQVKDIVASNLKSVRVGQRTNNRYFRAVSTDQGSMFDTKS